jgi:hypothetical protein
MTFSLAPVLLAAPVQPMLPEATGELVWLPCQKQTASLTPAVHPALLVHASYASLPAERVTFAHDSNMCSTNVTDGTSLGQYILFYTRGTPQEIRSIPWASWS